MSAFRKEAIFALAVLALGVLFWQQTGSMVESATIFPRILIGFIALLTTAMLFQAIKRGNDAPGLEVNVPRIISFMVLLALYIFTVEPIGYFVMTPIFVVVGCLFLRALGIVGSLCLGIGFSAFIYVLFVGFLHLPVPLGILEKIIGG